LIEFYTGKSLAQIKSGPIRRKRDREGACSNRRTGYRGQRPQVEACRKTRMWHRNSPVLEWWGGAMEWL